MKNFKDIILGIVIGAIVFVSLVVVKPMVYQYGHRAIADDIEADPLFNSDLYNQIKAESNGKLPLVAISAHRNVLDELFSSTYEDLYTLMFLFGAVSPENDALVELASGYNITPLEAQDIMGGSIEPVYNLLPFGGKNMTQHDILYTAEQFRRDFEDLYEIYQLKQDLGSSAYLSEVFSNGDLLDSGFDLVHDLDQIESVLFDIIEPVSSVDLGGAVDTADDQGMKETPYQKEIEGTEPEFSHAYYALELDADSSEEDLKNFDPASLVEYTDEDVCPDDDEDPLIDALSDYEQETEQYFEDNPVDIEETSDEPSEDQPVPEKASDFRRKEQCNGLLLFGHDPTKPTKGNVATETKTSTGVPIAEAEFYMCLEYNEKWEVYSSYVPDAPCLSCEFEKILAYMKKTLANSLVPNKLTGNLMESSLCKDKLLGFKNIDINFNIVWAPIEAPPNDDAIYGKSIFEEWSKFIKKNHPFLLETKDAAGNLHPLGYSQLPERITQMSEEWVKQNTSDNSDIQKIFSEITLMQEQFTNEAMRNVEKYQVSTKAEDFATYSDGVLAEVGQMKEYFKAFSGHFQKIAEEEGFCKSIQTKKTCE